MERVAVLDNGSGYCKLGFMHEFEPRISEPNCIGEKRSDPHITAIGKSQIENDLGGTYALRRPIQTGLILDTAVQFRVWEKLFSKLNQSFEKILILDTISAPNLSANRQLLELLFETTQISSVHFGTSQAYAINAFRSIDSENTNWLPTDQIDEYETQHNPYDPTDRKNTLTFLAAHLGPSPPAKSSAALANPCNMYVDLGYTGAVACPLFEAQVIDYAVQRNFAGGRMIDSEMQAILGFRDLKFTSMDFLLERVSSKNRSSCQLPFVRRFEWEHATPQNRPKDYLRSKSWLREIKGPSSEGICTTRQNIWSCMM